MKHEHHAILCEAYRRQRMHARLAPPPPWQPWAREAFDNQVEHGPEYRSGDWFGEMRDHARMRFRRAIGDLERGGLLVTWSRWGRRLSHVKLTAEGERIALELLRADRLERRRAGR